MISHLTAQLQIKFKLEMTTLGFRKIDRFTFADHDLAIRVRQKMMNTLVSFDDNRNGTFQQDQIEHLLIHILNEDPNEVRYVIYNVFRYDVDSDGAVTYDQFTNFAVEQHFGELAIQRLHRKQMYQRGSERLMNKQEFEKTLNYSLDFIKCRGSTEEYNRLFDEVDLDRDGWISYEHYFCFLREYFGSESYAASSSMQQIPPAPTPVPPVVVSPPAKRPESPDPNSESPEIRFAKLIYSQFKISVMERDKNRNLVLESNEVNSIMQEVLKLSQMECSLLVENIIGNADAIDYQSFMKFIVPYYYCEYLVENKALVSDRINEDSFVKVVDNASSFVKVRPPEHILRAVFQNADVDYDGWVSKSDYINTLGNIFENFRFDQRGKVVSRY